MDEQTPVPFDVDEIPPPPLAAEDQGAPEGEELTPSATIPSSLFDVIPKGGEPLPRNVYHFRLHSYTKEHTDGGPYFTLEWSCQQEPYVGRRAFENVSWVDEEVIEAALRGDTDALQIVKNRCWKAKEVMDAAGYKATSYSFEDFANTNPEQKLSLDLEEIKRKDEKGMLRPTGEFRNKVTRHIALHRAA